MKPTAARLHLLIWALIFGGLLAAVVGFALDRNGEPFGAVVVIASSVLVAIGAVLVWVRSRMSDS